MPGESCPGVGEPTVAGAVPRDPGFPNAGTRFSPGISQGFPENVTGFPENITEYYRISGRTFEFPVARSNFGRAKMEFARIHTKKNTEFRNEYMTFFTPDALVSSRGIDFRYESFFKLRRIFLSPFLASSNFSKFRPDVRDSRRPLWARAHVGLGPCGPGPIWARTFEILVERSYFWSNVRISG